MSQFYAVHTRNWAQHQLDTMPTDDEGKADLRGLSESEAVVTCVGSALVALGISLANDLERAVDKITGDDPANTDDGVE